MVHKDCILVKGIKYFKCIKCGNKGSNYRNGITVYRDCVDKLNICSICGESMDK